MIALKQLRKAMGNDVERLPKPCVVGSNPTGGADAFGPRRTQTAGLIPLHRSERFPIWPIQFCPQGRSAYGDRPSRIAQGKAVRHCDQPVAGGIGSTSW